MDTPATFDRHYIGANIRGVREAEGITLSQLSDRLAGHGLTLGKPTLSKIEGGTRQLTAEELMPFALALGVTPNDLLFGDQLEGLDLIDLTPAARHFAHSARAWANGDEPLMSSEEMQAPDSLREYWDRRVALRRRTKPYEYDHSPSEAEQRVLEADGTLPRLVSEYLAVRDRGLNDAFLLDYLTMASRYADHQPRSEKDS